MAAPKKRTVIAQDEYQSRFVEALNFVSVATKKQGAPFETHTKLAAKWAKAFNGVVAAAHIMEEELYACPHHQTLLDAMARCGDTFSITQMDRDRLAVKSGKFRAVVPCIDPELIGEIEPDMAIAPIDDRFKTAIGAVGILASESGQSVVDASLLIRSGSVVGTNRLVLFECWHGIDLPVMSLPKAGVVALTKQSKPLLGFGVSSSNATFHYEGAWIRSQFYSDTWPNVDSVFNKPHNAWPIPEGFFTALKAVSEFSTDGDVYFHDGVLRSHDSEAIGAAYEVRGLPRGPIFNAKRLAMIEPYAKQIDFMTNGEKILTFFGDNIRGVVCGR